jgi:hypothetical protein
MIALDTQARKVSTRLVWTKTWWPAIPAHSPFDARGVLQRGGMASLHFDPDLLSIAGDSDGWRSPIPTPEYSGQAPTVVIHKNPQREPCPCTSAGTEAGLDGWWEVARSDLKRSYVT